MNFIQVSCLVAQAQCLTNWGDCGLLYNAYLKNLQPFTRKGQRFFFHPFYPQLLDPNSAVAPYLGFDTPN